ncbi:toluene monooxygenase [Halieaceae bacterium IMCC8485]|uniref:Toluene monooxygenase n=1 Tax=Candidatus Seongchinamella marina TaxID=2518990 RepID=A0ABT3T003_9GAMM|nr:toluene-4-monooxygenase system B family protein [Candidatus Seongchinamella marina]MCX2975495.1 toluene monooxygenase [Candidatus Seongchinamella marina]
MALFPLHSSFQADFVVQLVPVDSEDTMDRVAEQCAHHSVNRRVRKQPGVMRVRRHRTEELFPRDMKVSDSGLKPTEVIDIIYQQS